MSAEPTARKPTKAREASDRPVERQAETGVGRAVRIRDREPHSMRKRSFSCNGLGRMALGEFQERRYKGRSPFSSTRGITFSVVRIPARSRRIFPYDMIPRRSPSKEWVSLEEALQQAHSRRSILSLRTVYTTAASARKGGAAELVLNKKRSVIA